MAEDFDDSGEWTYAESIGEADPDPEDGSGVQNGHPYGTDPARARPKYLDSYVPSYQGKARRIEETSKTCPYWIHRVVAGVVVGFVWGCGGYGEVTPDHPAARYPDGEMWQFTENPWDGVLCARCRGTGRIRA